MSNDKWTSGLDGADIGEDEVSADGIRPTRGAVETEVMTTVSRYVTHDEKERGKDLASAPRSRDRYQKCLRVN